MRRSIFMAVFMTFFICLSLILPNNSAFAQEKRKIWTRDQLISPEVACVTSAEGTIEVPVGEATATLDEGEAISTEFDPVTGVACIVAIEGEIPVTAHGVTVILKPGMGTCIAPDPELPPTTPVQMAYTCPPVGIEAYEPPVPVWWGPEEPPIQDTEPASQV
jgi:hypothetical protein